MMVFTGPGADKHESLRRLAARKICVTNRVARSSFQKFSIIHKLLSTFQPRIAKWRPSGEGTP